MSEVRLKVEDKLCDWGVVRQTMVHSDIHGLFPTALE